eukprot:TRINITY_DN54777_c0_g1_i1.p1 TRINITY_DN54777_c0_g1~~TRINITY_DN54777_c0_g1_i1.p1  ORF type:complete len:478 (+),score=-32.67 TRINITY_DN54777_c0_g1_i1:61-1494(+)
MMLSLYFTRSYSSKLLKQCLCTTSLSSTSIDKMKSDKRYQPKNEVPDEILKNMNSDKSHGFSIKGDELAGRPAYMDFQATTPLDPRVLDVMLPYMVGRYGNPHSKTHSYGWETEKAVEEAREHVANLIGANPKEIVFTSGATESNNLALKGVAEFYKEKKNHIITCQTEHKCVLDSCRALEQLGYEVTYLPVNSNGIISLTDLENCIKKNQTSICSIMGVNNEIGVIQPLKEIGEICRKNKAFFHSDIAQMIGKVPVDVNELNIDLASISSHKIYGPKGIGALYTRRKNPRVRLYPQISGGGQERGLRSGTLAPALCVGLGEAARICKEELLRDEKWVKYLSNKLQSGIAARIPMVTINGNDDSRYAGNLNVSFAYVEGESLLMALKNIAVSSGSACTSASLEPSYVLRALGADAEQAHSSIRFGIGRFTTEAEVDLTLDLLEKHVNRLREMSPLWEMVQDGIDLTTIQWTQDHHHH